MKKYLEILKKCPLFDAIGDENLEAMLGCFGARVAAYRKNETILREGEPATHIGIVLSGAARLERTDFYGNRSIKASIGPAELFGEAFACAGAAAAEVDVIAAENTEVLLIACRKITGTCCNACAFHNQIILNLLKVVATKNIMLNQKAEILSRRTTREKLMAYLLAQAKQQGNSFTIPYDRQGLADYLEVDRSGLSAEISKLRAEGVLQSRRNWFRLL